MSLPPLYSCHYCHEEVQTKSVNTLSLTTGWITQSGKTIKKVEQQHHKYCHEWCLPPQKALDQTLSMF